MKEIKIAGFTSDLTPSDKPTISVFGEESSGKTRFAATMPDADGEGAIGLLALDLNCKRTFEKIAKEMKRHVIANKANYISPVDARRMAMLDGEKSDELRQVKTFYGEVYKRLLDDAARLADHERIVSVVLDSNTQFWNWIMFSHFGRRNQVETFQRGAPNDDMNEFISMLNHKNLCLIHRAAEVWKDTGEVDKNGRKKQAPSGKFKLDGCSKIGYLVTTELELFSKAKAESLEDKFHVRVRECHTNPLIEGQDLDGYGIVGEQITWDNIITAIGWQGAQ